MLRFHRIKVLILQSYFLATVPVILRPKTRSAQPKRVMRYSLLGQLRDLVVSSAACCSFVLRAYTPRCLVHLQCKGLVAFILIQTKHTPHISASAYEFLVHWPLKHFSIGVRCELNNKLDRGAVPDLVGTFASESIRSS